MFETLTGWEWVVFIVLVLLFFIGAAVFVIVLLYKRAWPESYVVLDDIDGTGRYKIVRRGKCKKVGFGDGGEEIYHLSGINKYRAAYGKKIGKNQTMWCIGEDGLWYNSDFGDFNLKLKQMGFNPIEKTARHLNTVIRKGLKDKYQEKTFMEKWFLPITLGLFLIVIFALAGTIWYVGSNTAKWSASNAAAMETAKAVLESANSVLQRIDQINPGGSGLRT